MAEDPPPRWRVLSRRRVLEDRWLALDAERLETPSGRIVEPWYLAHGHAWACAVPLTPEGHLVMVEQYRRGPDAWVLEVPAGNCEPGESPAAAAVRELAEESGYRPAAPAIALGRWWPEPAHNTAHASGFLVRVDPQPLAAAPDPEEHLRVVVLTPPAVEEAIASGRFCHGVQIGFWYAARARGLR